ncbi:hypothetical protein C9374_007873 [Naegleria lovaniensis]|uniref:Uncharacterized protein n=1 Tax=Naegleria lovaniensis TaxID=51637 RepID=A0AA88GL17_NAELO|nr:uncharacterized protein C9374_007873 [Naegleria lovaniensis]KAG2378725.1 hypothetical protein C9374_007873 [Naegleria lovaniensis]
MFGFTSESTSRSDNLNYYSPPPRHPAFRASQRYETTPSFSDDVTSPSTSKTSSQDASSTSVANTILPIQLLILNSSFTPLLVSGSSSSADASSTSFLNSFSQPSPNNTNPPPSSSLTTSTSVSSGNNANPPPSSFFTALSQQQGNNLTSTSSNVVLDPTTITTTTTPSVTTTTSASNLDMTSPKSATTHKDSSTAASSYHSTTSSGSTTSSSTMGGATATSLSILFQQHQQKNNPLNSPSSNNNNNNSLNTNHHDRNASSSISSSSGGGGCTVEPISSLLLSSLSGSASATGGSSTPRSGGASSSSSSSTTPRLRPQSARYASSSLSTSSWDKQQSGNLSTSNHSLGGVSTGTAVGAGAATSFISSKSDGASTTGIKTSGTHHGMEGNGNWATSKQYRDGMEHIHKLREKFMDYVGTVHWWNGGHTTSLNSGTASTSSPTVLPPSISSSSSSTASKDSSEIKKQRSMIECASKLIFLDEFYDALNMRVRSFETIKDVIQCIDTMCKILLNFAEKKQGYVRSGTTSLSSGGTASSTLNVDTDQQHETITYQQPVLLLGSSKGTSTTSSNSSSSSLATSLKHDRSKHHPTTGLSRDPSSEEMGTNDRSSSGDDGGVSGMKDLVPNYLTSKPKKDNMDVPHLKEFVSAMEQNRLYPCFQHERLRDLLITVWLEISKCESGGEEKLSAFFNSPMKRAIVDSDRVNNTLANSNRNSMNASTLLALNEKSGVDQLSLFNSNLMRKESSKTWSLDKIFHIEENTADRLANDIKILTDMFLIELEDVLAVFQEKHSKFVKNWITEAYEKCLLPFHAIQAIKKRKDTLKTLRNEFVFEEDDFEAKYVIDKDWRFVSKLCEHTSDWKLNSKNIPLVMSWSSVENYSSMPDMRLTKFVGYVDYSLENVMRAYCHDKSLDRIYSSKVQWHEYCKPCASSSLEKYPTAIMTTVNESSGLFKKQTMEMVVSGKTKFIGGENMTELFQGAFFFKSCNHLKNTKEGKSDSDSKLISIGARFFTKIDNCRTRIIEVKFSRIVGFLKKTFLFPMNMKKEMSLFHASMIEILEREQEQGFPIASNEDHLMRIICDYAKLYCRVDFKLKYTSTDDDIVL